MVDAGVADGARIHLLHKYDRPYYFGVDTLCDAGSENAEQFLQLAAQLVSQSETQLIRRGNDPVLPSDVQHKLLRERAAQLIREWDFPQCDLVRRLADGIATQCLAKSREGNAPLGGGANGVGIPQDEFDSIPRNNPGLARVIKFGVAYNAFALVPNHRTKNRTWCLIELGGVLLLHHGLTLKRGGFLERRVDDLVHLLARWLTYGCWRQSLAKGLASRPQRTPIWRGSRCISDFAAATTSTLPPPALSSQAATVAPSGSPITSRGVATVARWPV